MMKPSRFLPVLLPSLALTITSPANAQLPNLLPAQHSTPGVSSSSAIFSGVTTVENSAVPLKSGDRLTVTVVGFPDLSGEHTVAADGTIQIPLVGYMTVGGLTPGQVVPQLTERLRPYVRRPQVGLAIVSLSPLRVSVTGAVVQPGPRLLSPTRESDPTLNNEGSPITLSDALILAGGITPDADLRNIVIRRINSNGRGFTDLQVDLWEAIQGGDLAADPVILDGDEVLVPKTTYSNVDQRMLLASTVAPTRIIIHVAGEVRQPGQIDITPNADVSAAVAAAGGLTEDADNSSLTLYRMAPDGRLEQQKFAFGGVSTTLMQGDLIVVNPSNRGNVGTVFDFLGRILNPIGSLVNIFDTNN